MLQGLVCAPAGRADWGVNLNTVARAYGELAQRGVLETRSGGGTIVARHASMLSTEGERRGALRRVEPVAEAPAERLRALAG